MRADSCCKSAIRASRARRTRRAGARRRSCASASARGCRHSSEPFSVRSGVNAQPPDLEDDNDDETPRISKWAKGKGKAKRTQAEGQQAQQANVTGDDFDDGAQVEGKSDEDNLELKVPAILGKEDMWLIQTLIAGLQVRSWIGRLVKQYRQPAAGKLKAGQWRQPSHTCLRAHPLLSTHHTQTPDREGQVTHPQLPQDSCTSLPAFVHPSLTTISHAS